MTPPLITFHLSAQVSLLHFSRYRDGVTETTPVVAWLWQTLESFTNEERVLFLRFVSGRSRLPVRVSEITQRLQISAQRQVHVHCYLTDIVLHNKCMVIANILRQCS